jgi:hypothetical protein
MGTALTLMTHEESGCDKARKRFAAEPEPRVALAGFKSAAA